MMGDGPAHDADPIDRTAQLEALRIELLTRSRRSRLIQKIDHSILPIDADEYGYCGACGIETSIMRM